MPWPQVDFDEFALGVSRLLRGSPAEQLRAIFALYDADGNGKVDR